MTPKRGEDWKVVARIEVVGGPWPERIGCTGVIVEGGRDEYPFWCKAVHEVVLRLDNDPLTQIMRDYSCVMSRSSVKILDPAGVTKGTPQ